MAIDFDATLEVVYNIQGKVNDIYKLVGVARNAKVSVLEIGDIPFTTLQKTVLVNKYISLKDELIVLFGQLP